MPVTSSPSSSTVPSLGSSKPAIMRRVVVLPQPEGPSIVKNSPRGISRSICLTAAKSPKRFVTPRKVTLGSSSPSLTLTASYGRSGVTASGKRPKSPTFNTPDWYNAMLRDSPTAG